LNPSEAQACALAQALRIPVGEDPIATLEAFVAERGHANELEAHRTAWARAAARTPHGAPIELTPADFAVRSGDAEAAVDVDDRARDPARPR
jgi:hypothetical protein